MSADSITLSSVIVTTGGILYYASQQDWGKVVLIPAVGFCTAKAGEYLNVKNIEAVGQSIIFASFYGVPASIVGFGSYFFGGRTIEAGLLGSILSLNVLYCVHDYVIDQLAKQVVRQSCRIN